MAISDLGIRHVSKHCVREKAELPGSDGDEGWTCHCLTKCFPVACSSLQVLSVAGVGNLRGFCFFE